MSAPWPGRCLVCLTLLPRRRWWQHGPFRPLPLCHRTDAVACHARSLRPWWNR